jgi:hypothetical protein
MKPVLLADEWVRPVRMEKYVCIECGHPLHISNKNVSPIWDPNFNGELANVANQIAAPDDIGVTQLAVEQCPKCYGELREPLEALKKILGRESL